jgi:predicted nuclease of restriction endonuclease-like (RecB) superfamily
MSKLIKIDDNYAGWIKDLSLRFRQSQIKAAVNVNSEMLKFYFSLGADIVTKQAESKWGKSFFSTLSQDLQQLLPEAKCFSETNLRYMKRFYQLYFNNLVKLPQIGAELGVVDEKNLPQVGAEMEIVPKVEGNIGIYPQVGDESTPQAVAQLFSIPWGHHKLIIDKLMGQPQKALFYVNKVYENNWSRAVLLNFLDTDLYERQGKAVTNFKATLPDVQGDLAQQLLKDPYCFDFIQLTDRYNEKELKDALVHNVEKFLLEMGNGFAYMGREYRIEVGGTELFADMLFYNTHLHCYVVVEVKTEKFDNAFLGQLSGYVSCANHVLRREGDSPTVGLLICKSKNDVMAQYALEGYAQPLGISEYELSKLYPADFKSTLPSIEDIERELR